MEKQYTEFEGMELIIRNSHESNIGSFVNLYENDLLGQTFIQDSISKNTFAGTIRGMHLQKGKFSQGKLVSCIQGSIIDFFIDFRRDSDNFCNYGKVKLDSREPSSLWIPRGFAHGFITLEQSTIVSYKLDNIYNPEAEMTLKWDDHSIQINWPDMDKYYLSDKDLQGQSLKEVLKELNEAK